MAIGDPSLFATHASFLRQRSQPMHYLAKVLREQGEFVEAQQLLIDAIDDRQKAEMGASREHQGLLADHWSELGLTYYRSGEYSQAIDAAQQSMRLASRYDARNLLVLAMAQRQQHDVDKAHLCHAKARSLIQKMRMPSDELTHLRAEADRLLRVE